MQLLQPEDGRLFAAAPGRRLDHALRDAPEPATWVCFACCAACRRRQGRRLLTALSHPPCTYEAF